MPNKRITIFGLMLLVCWIAIVVFNGLGWNPFGLPWNFENSGGFGDSFGPLGAIMAGIAAVAAFGTLKEQRAEFRRIAEREQAEDKRREELDAMNERVRRLRQASEAKQLFESTFFNMLASHREIVKETDTGRGENRKISRDAFKSFTTHLLIIFERTNDLEMSWSEIIEQNKNDLNHYFRFLYHIIRYVDLQEYIDKYFYIRLVRAGLSESELILIFANCAVGEGSEKFKPLIEKYALLHNVSKSSKDDWNMQKYFDESAFQYGDCE